MLSHGNICANVKQVIDASPDFETLRQDDDCSLAFLPWAHSYGQLSELHGTLAAGAMAGIAAGALGDQEELLKNINAVKPTVLFSVPTLFIKVHAQVQQKIADEPSPLRKAIISKALAVGHAVAEHRRLATLPGPILSLQHQFFDKVVLSKIREALGGRLRICVVGGAPTPEVVLEVNSA